MVAVVSFLVDVVDSLLSNYFPTVVAGSVRLFGMVVVRAVVAWLMEQEYYMAVFVLA
eukprot:Awhi_evm1s2326